MSTTVEENERPDTRKVRLLDLCYRGSLAWCRLKTRLWYAHVFRSVGAKTTIFRPMLLVNVHHASIGESVLIRPGARIQLIVTDAAAPPRLTIGSRVNIEQNVHIVCGSSIEIGDDVTITGNVAIVDVEHPHEDVNDKTRIGDRIRTGGNYVLIGQGSFIGFNAVILPNVKIGRHAVVGALSVVTRDVPDYCVVIGNPAQIVKRYNFETKCWEREKK
ncbi:acetyltransferase-like isoleucine patch superfamily enzyme [Paraburkholderia sp. BL6665CI2N2]|uniref:acyltransferase n=1 Tax=Paraburkholderia sp. BL6665CI2N2 TaxID=1938806 RepID=UPI001064D180|nr:acyltransferase [Paraburkholderia sp. BL6665CI2N2]TDY25504.1 acetyltransferase-like isoleucine patch superfamily enzyme [Paraburkholderia sp. BL6665CI2N2]